MDNRRKNYNQEWGNEIARQFRRAWNGELPFDAFAQLFDTSLVFHFHDRDLHGIDAYRCFIEEARRTTRNLDLAEEIVLTHGDKVMFVFRWKSEAWHRDIIAGNAHSNYCKAVFRVVDGRIAELWQQSPDFLYLLGKQPLKAPMIYPQVVEESLLIWEDDGIYPTDDAETRMMSELFKRMNDCFLNRSSLRNMRDIQNEDIVYNTGGMQGKGVQSWKTFVYALHTCLGTGKGTRFDDLYVRDGDRLRVFLRASVDQLSPYILKSAEGLIAAMKLRSRNGKIQSLETQLENYIQFLDTDFSRHPERLKNLFRGQREPVTEAIEPAHGILGQTQAGSPAVDRDAVAIVGMAGRFPKCGSVDEYWRALVAGRALFSEIPQERVYIRRGTVIRHAGFLDNVDRFDAAFFQMLPSEAQFVDPQQRLLLEEIVHSMEDSGHAIADYAGTRTGLFIATLSEDYQKLLQEQGLVNHPHTWAGNENAMFPAKVARFLNIQGPCHFVNAECTSSLVAIHEASRLIREGEIDQAIVGATNLLLHPYGFAVRTGTLLSEEPHARLFSKHSRGQLRGEAIVSVILKSLSKAIADGDHVYGIVAGSAVNNSGKTLSLVAGNVDQQAAVMTTAWQAAGVRPEDISTIECHASGVRGGDFAEVAAIKKALGKEANAPAQPCRLSTVKGAIGHAEAASGMTALVKVLLQLRHGQIVGIQGLEEPDPELGIDPKRIELVRESMPWARAESNGVARPRIAGINGFAAGGYNAHVVIKEYVDNPRTPSTARHAAAPADSVIVLSAQSEASLAAQLRGLKLYLVAHPETDLADLAVTLQLRGAMKHRTAFVVARVDELVPLIDAVLHGSPLPPNVFVGRSGKTAGTAADAHAVSESDAFRLAQRWTEGRAVDWGTNAARRRQRLADLPLYPFDPKSYWLPAPAKGTAQVATDVLHPMLHRNVSDMFGQRYKTVLTGSERYLADHVVRDHAILPGVAYLEMVRAAACDALARDDKGSSAGNAAVGVQLRNVVWLQPIATDPGNQAALEVQVELTPLAQDEHALRAAGTLPQLAFEIVTMAGDQPRLHCQGQVVMNAADSPAPVDLSALRTACERSEVSAQQVYAAYGELGIHYGPSYRTLKSLHIGVNDTGARDVLARLELPATAEHDDDCILHPSMMDGAVHAAIGLVMDAQATPAYRKPPLPFALDRLQVLRPCTASMWAWIRFLPGSDGASRVQKLDIDLFDDDGRLCVAMGGFTSRTGDKEPKREMKERMEAADPVPAAGPDAQELHDRVLALLKQEVAQILQVAQDDIDPQDELSEYGFDSINLTAFGNRLNEEYRLPADRPLNPTVFFEYPTLVSFTRYLVATYGDAVTARYAPRHAQAVALRPEQETADVPVQMYEAAGESGLAARRFTRRFVGQTATPAVNVENADIAIVGVSGRFPMANDLDAFWENLVSGRDCITEVPTDRWDWRAAYGNPLKEPHKTDVKWGGFIDGIAEFDPLFFGISPREAELMDPQHRLLLQHVWQAIEDAGYSSQSLSGTRTGVFLATANSGYTGLVTQAGNPVEGSTITGMVPSVAPNRISYLLNLHGPSEPIETACSSSLVAIHRAIVAMQAGTCDMAIVGGVNTIVTPEGHIGFRKAGMLCDDGRCKTFSSRANGYVRGEGVGILFLKKLPDAKRSADHIYAVIKGSAENHGGRANSLTAPNPKAQAELIKAAYMQARIDPATVGYIEAHGTGTELGDPIEVNGLRSAFGDLYQAAGRSRVESTHCGLGSVKSNIGHLELAAGIAGVIKVLLQLKHKTLVKSLHTEEINPYVQLDGSPFYVVRENRPWPAPTDVHGRVLPRRAGVSSFGFGGANAHVVIEEYHAPTQDAPAPSAVQGPFIVVLSARTEKQLQQYAKQLLQAVQVSPYRGTVFTDKDLPDIAYTLQVGRDAMEQRLGLVVHSLADLRTKLKAVIDGSVDGMEDVYRGAVKPNRDAVAIFHADEDLKAAVDSWIAKGKYKKLLQLWVKGLALDWEHLHAATPSHPRRVSLPTYPFAQERYWVPAANAIAVTERHAQVPTIHPLVHRNTSDFSQQRYSATFYGQEFFLRDHVAMGRPLLPAAAYLEMVRAAIADAAGPAQAGKSIRLRNVVWPQPIMLESTGDSPVTAHVKLALEQNGEIAFEVYTSASALHCQGIASLHPDDAADMLDIAALEAQHMRSKRSAEEIYGAFDRLGLQYGPAHRAVEQLCIGETAGADLQVLAKLRLPVSLAGDLPDYVMHPSLLDAALQSGIGFLLHGEPQENGGRTPLPFHLKQLEVLAPCTMSMWAWARRSQGDAAHGADRSVQTLDIDLCDDSGRICVRIKGFASRVLAGGQLPARQESAHNDKPHSLMLAPTWEPVTERPQAHEHAALWPAQTDRVLIVAEAEAASALRRLYPQAAVVENFPAGSAGDLNDLDHIVWFALQLPPVSVTEESLLEDQERGVLSLFRAIKSMLALGYGVKPLAWTFVTTQAHAVQENEILNPAQAAVVGLAGTMAKEYTSWKVRTVDLPLGWIERTNDTASPLSLQEVLSLPSSNTGGAWVYRDGMWYRQKLAPLHVLNRAAALPARDSSYKSGGVYVVIGGAGGIGEVWTEYMIRTYAAQIIWIGRREPDAAIRSRLDRLAAFGPAPLYLQADATQREQLQAACDAIRGKFGRIHGVVHSAIVLKDQSLANMTESDFRSAFAAKADISVRIAQVFQAEQLDFVLFFSSLVAFAAPPGQGNYVAGCAFKDAFALRLATEWPCAVKVMNWGFWGSVGVAASEEYRRRMAQLGVGSIEPGEAMDALEVLLSDSLNRTALVSVTRPLAELSKGIYSAFLAGGEDAPRKPAIVTEQAKRQAAQPSGKVEDYVVETIKKILSEALKVDIDEIDVDEAFTDYGLDSITGVHLAQTLNQRFDLELDVTLFFDHGTVRSLADYLLSSQADAMARFVDSATGTPTADVPAAGSEPMSAVHDIVPTARRFASIPLSQDKASAASDADSLPVEESGKTDDGIAIVGVSGSFPMADNVDELWSNLINGKECVTEVPKERWDWEQVTGDPSQDVDQACFQWGSFIDGVDRFDAEFFGVSAEEAMYMSPQQRLLLTHVWKAIEDAGIAPRSLAKDPTGVFIASVPSEYLNTVADLKDVPLMVMGLSTSMLPNRISHTLNLRGPSEHCDTACSSTLVALHRAVQSIRNGECRQAIVGAVNLLLTPAAYIGFESMGYLTPSGRMAAFQPDANGFVRAESVGAVLLKPLQQAIEDRDQIYAVIRGTGVSHGGSAVSMTTPNGAGMREAIRHAYESSGIDPRTVSYVEAHGIASPLGDAIEISALKSEYDRLAPAFADGAVADDTCYIGSSRSCVGYPEVASGMLSLIKVLMALRHATLPGIPRFTKLHDNIVLKNSRFRLTADNQPWVAKIDADGHMLPRRAAINNYGFSGVNAHLVLEEFLPVAQAAQADPSESSGEKQLVVLSARTSERLQESARQMLDLVRSRADLSLADIAYTLQVGREPMAFRMAVAAGNLDTLAEGLQSFLDAPSNTRTGVAEASVYAGKFTKTAKGRAEAAVVEAWVQQKQLDDLARHWVRGGDVPWERLHAGGCPRRVSLPGHPLEPVSYWVSGATGISELHSQRRKPVRRTKRKIAVAA